MSTESESFWPQDILDHDVDVPSLLLKQAASELTEKTAGVLEGEVKLLETDQYGGQMHFQFRVVAPALGNYRVVLFECIQPLTLYPVRIVRGLLDKEMGAADKEELQEVLRKALSGDNVRRVVSALLAQSASPAKL